MANVCDHKPTKVIGGIAGSAAAIGIGMKAAGLYVFPHAAGMAMLGSTAAGSSAAGTVGIIGGTAGVIGSTGAVLMSPIVNGEVSLPTIECGPVALKLIQQSVCSSILVY